MVWSQVERQKQKSRRTYYAKPQSEMKSRFYQLLIYGALEGFLAVISRIDEHSHNFLMIPLPRQFVVVFLVSSSLQPLASLSQYPLMCLHYASLNGL